MLTDMGTILRQAKKEGYGVAAPNAWSLNTVKSIFEAASELKAPIIIDGAGIHQIEEVSDAVHFYEKIGMHIQKIGMEKILHSADDV